MQTMPSKEEILGLERRFWDAMKTGDVNSAIALTKFPCIVAGPTGAHRMNEAEFRKIMQSTPTDRLGDAEIQNPQVDVLNAETALISYSTTINGMKMLDVSTWVREGDNWACVFHSENPLS